MNTIKKLASTLAVEISERRVYNIPEIETMIYVQVKSSMKEILKEELTDQEKEYYKALELQSVLKVGSQQYVQNGYKLGLLKQKKAMINRSLAQINRETTNTNLKDFVREIHGLDVLMEILNKDKHEEKEA